MIDKIALEIIQVTRDSSILTNLLIPTTVEDFRKVPKEIKNFYRKIAVWHLKKIKYKRYEKIKKCHEIDYDCLESY